ncbi:hypothetical protein [Dyadobacter sp. NIV53]|uniref:hypothetical protein n=1 Tax=Dyadobacter sp. NIV53 TaxID=2861765 RepID=UPI001C88A050|nr:hypothetical protein [Dyadobacter sp. NIV53]
MTKIPNFNAPSLHSSQNQRFVVSIRFVLRYTPSRIKESILYVRTTVNGTRAPERSLNMKIVKSEWDSTQQTILGNSDQAQICNARIQQVKTLFDKTFFLMQQSGESITAKRLQERVFGEKAQYSSYKDAFNRFIAEKITTTKVSPRTIETYNKYYRHISSFLKVTDIKISYFKTFQRRICLIF